MIQETNSWWASRLLCRLWPSEWGGDQCADPRFSRNLRNPFPMQWTPVYCVYSDKNAYLRMKIGLGEQWYRKLRSRPRHLTKPQWNSTLSAALTVQGILQWCYVGFLNSVSGKAAVHSIGHHLNEVWPVDEGPWFFILTILFSKCTQQLIHAHWRTLSTPQKGIVWKWCNALCTWRNSPYPIKGTLHSFQIVAINFSRWITFSSFCSICHCASPVIALPYPGSHAR